MIKIENGLHKISDNLYIIQDDNIQVAISVGYCKIIKRNRYMVIVGGRVYDEAQDLEEAIKIAHKYITENRNLVFHIILVF